MDLTLFEAIVLALGAIGFGTILLVRGGDWTVDSAAYIAARYGMSPMMIGFTILAFGTSLPELIVSVLANLQGTPGIALGNVLGSNIANVALVLAVAALIAPLKTASKVIKWHLLFMMGATAMLAFLMMHDLLTRTAGGLMIAALLAYILFQYWLTKQGLVDQEDGDEDGEDFASLGSALFFLLVGLIAVALGAEFLVRGARVGASAIGVPDAVIALSLIALGTSLPELSTSISAMKKGQSDMLIGNIVGSNVFNILMIMGVATLVKPIAASDFAAQLVNFDIWVASAIALILAAFIFIFKGFGRIVGAGLLLFYVLYNVYIYALYVAP